MKYRKRKENFKTHSLTEPCGLANSLGASDEDQMYDVRFVVQNSAGHELGKISHCIYF